MEEGNTPDGPGRYPPPPPLVHPNFNREPGLEEGKKENEIAGSAKGACKGDSKSITSRKWSSGVQHDEFHSSSSEGPFHMHNNFGFPITNAAIGKRLKALQGACGDKNWISLMNLLNEYRRQENKVFSVLSPLPQQQQQQTKKQQQFPIIEEPLGLPPSPPYSSKPTKRAGSGTYGGGSSSSSDCKPRKQSLSWTEGIDTFHYQFQDDLDEDDEEDDYDDENENDDGGGGGHSRSQDEENVATSSNETKVPASQALVEKVEEEKEDSRDTLHNLVVVDEEGDENHEGGDQNTRKRREKKKKKKKKKNSNIDPDLTSPSSVRSAVGSRDRLPNSTERLRRRKSTAKYFKGIGKGIAGVPIGVFSGVAGIVSKPVKGAKDHGAVGMLRGMGHAITGVVKAPLQAVADLTDSVAGESEERKSSSAAPSTSYLRRRKRSLSKTFMGRQFLLGIAGLGKGVLKGAFGVFTEPVRLAQKQGVKGFFKGVGTGLVGVVGQPVKGVVRFIEGIDRSIEADMTDDDLRFGDLALYRKVVKHGIPSAIRASVWDVASGARSLRRISGAGYFEERVAESREMLQVLEKAMDILRLSKRSEEERKGEDSEERNTQKKIDDDDDDGVDDVTKGLEYSDLVLEMSKRHPKLTPTERVIIKDLDRTYPEHPYIGSPRGITALAKVLGAFARHNPTVGYCQGLNFVAGLALIVMATEEAAFWFLVAVCENILPVNYHDEHLINAKADSHVIQKLVLKRQGKIARHLERYAVPLDSCVLHWFVALFASSLPTHTVVRIWDLLLFRGRIFLHEVSYALIVQNRKRILSTKDPGMLFNLMSKLGEKDGAKDLELLRKASALKFPMDGLQAIFEECKEELQKALQKSQDTFKDSKEGCWKESKQPNSDLKSGHLEVIDPQGETLSTKEK